MGKIKSVEIKSAYVSVKQAELFDEKGLRCDSDYNQWILAKDKNDDSKRFICLSDDLENHTYIDGDKEHNVYHCLTIPEQWQVVEWLRVEKGIWVSVNIAPDMKTFSAYVTHKKKGGWDSKEFNSPQEAYSAAFDHILKELI